MYMRYCNNRIIVYLCMDWRSNELKEHISVWCKKHLFAASAKYIISWLKIGKCNHVNINIGTLIILNMWKSNIVSLYAKSFQKFFKNTNT